jgi:hypothetical protein
LEEFAVNSILQTGFFHCGPEPEMNRLFYGSSYSKSHRIQTGIIRTNCIDCLDLTNAAQFVIGMRALGVQLHALTVDDELKYHVVCIQLKPKMKAKWTPT